MSCKPEELNQCFGPLSCKHSSAQLVICRAACCITYYKLYTSIGQLCYLAELIITPLCSGSAWWQRALLAVLQEYAVFLHNNHVSGTLPSSWGNLHEASIPMACVGASCTPHYNQIMHYAGGKCLQQRQNCFLAYMRCMQPQWLHVCILARSTMLHHCFTIHE